MKKVNQSEVMLVFTDIFLMYVAIKRDYQIRQRAYSKRVKPITTSFIKPAKKIWPFPNIEGLFKPKNKLLSTEC